MLMFNRKMKQGPSQAKHQHRYMLRSKDEKNAEQAEQKPDQLESRESRLPSAYHYDFRPRNLGLRSPKACIPLLYCLPCPSCLSAFTTFSNIILYIFLASFGYNFRKRYETDMPMTAPHQKTSCYKPPDARKPETPRRPPLAEKLKTLQESTMAF